MPNSPSNQPRRTLLLTGASRGIGHATVKRFSAAGWRVITCSRHPFPENCPWDAGPEDHIQVDLSDEANTTEAIAEIKRRLDNGELHALVNNAAISPKAEGGKRLGSLDTDIGTWQRVFAVNFFAPIMLARGLVDELKTAKGFASTPSRRARSTPRSCRRAPRRSSSRFRCSASARPTKSPRSSMCCARKPVLT
jgi:NAD(P)-dependent dehydrogenase (short-subunit alcohol dehydrogenase family)